MSIPSFISKVEETEADAREGWRWHWAGLIMASLLGELIKNTDKRVPLQAAELAVGFADELLAELQRTQ